MHSSPSLASALEGCLLGTAVGDALGLPREGLSPEKAGRLFGDEVRHRLIAGRGMLSDDTEHAAMTAQALTRHVGDADAFGRDLAWRLRWWSLALPPGVGLATARACMKLWLGFSYESSGVFSAGNGPLMRAPVIGVALAHEGGEAVRFTARSTGLTHRGPKPLRAAMAAALAASFSLRNPGQAVAAKPVLADLRLYLSDDDPEWMELLDRVGDPSPLANEFPRGPGGYCYHTLLAVLHTWLHTPGGFREPMERLLRLGGDADTTGAILGGIAGGNLGVEAIPQPWLDGIADWPRSVPWLREVAHRLADAKAGVAGVAPPEVFWPATLARNLFLLPIIIGHGLWRLWPRGGECTGNDQGA